ncbi:MAG TPA: DNA topoisomerase IV subunit B [Alphaproteobacteria bacterium]|nr:DNA topoisomerase IV subunit B [Alphaproteobacteria bacterium]
MPDLFDTGSRGPGKGKGDASYTAKDIEVLEGLEPVRRRPGMYIGGTDERAMHHLVAELLDNAMDEVVAGHASWIEIDLEADNFVAVRDNGRGIPTDKHPKFRDKSALEVILTTLHSGGKFSDKVYDTAGGLHGVGLSVVNALADKLTVEVARDRKLWVQEYSRGKPKGKLKEAGGVSNRRGTVVRFHADPEIFGASAHFRPERLYRMARSKAYLTRVVEIRWKCAEALLKGVEGIPAEETIHFPGGLQDYLAATLEERKTITALPFAGEAKFSDGQGRVEWAIAWPLDGEGFCNSYCNAIPTPEGGSHELGLRSALARSMRAYGELLGNRKAKQITAEDVVDGAATMLSLFVRNPSFQGQTKEKLSMPEAAKLVEQHLKDHFDHWLSADPATSKTLLDAIVERAEERQRRREARELNRKTATRNLRLPGKLADCARRSSDDTEIFLVEGDSAGGSAKQARDRETQAVLPLRGKILNVASASAEKLRGNQEIADLAQALGCGVGAHYSSDKLRYDRVIIMTDADVDGAHIASLLMTFFYKEMRGLIEDGRLFLALPPLYRLSQGGKVVYARDDKHKEELLKKEFGARGKVEVSRFKGLGEMPPAQLRETTMNAKTRTLLQVQLPNGHAKSKELNASQTAALVEQLMGRKPELRMAFIQENARFVKEIDV